MARAGASELLEQALSLPTEERLALATELLNSVEGREDQEWGEAWVKELDRRAAAVERGEEALEDWASVEARILADLRGR